MNALQLIITAIALLQAVNHPGVDAKLREQAILFANQAIAVAIAEQTAEQTAEQALEAPKLAPTATSTPEVKADATSTPGTCEAVRDAKTKLFNFNC
jgi:hypothetical protein